MDLYFSDYFDVDPKVVEDYGAFDINLVSDLPLFVDPFLLFHSKKPEYQALHQDIIKYLVFLRDKASPDLETALINSWYRFKEVKQNWLGFTYLGNEGSGLGAKFAKALHGSLGSILGTFGEEKITKGSHLEKLTLIKGGVGRDNISDFTTNLIKGYLLDYTEKFAADHLSAEQRQSFAITRAIFNFGTEAWETRSYDLPHRNNDFVLLTPADMLTRDDTWISHSDMIKNFHRLPEAVSDDQLRAQINNYFASLLSKKPTTKERAEAAQRTIFKFPDLVDYYIRAREDSGDHAVGVSEKRREDTHELLVKMVRDVIADIEARGTLYGSRVTSYEEALARVLGFKQYVENQDGYKLINKSGRTKQFSNEHDVQLFFGVILFGSEFDVNREVNNGRGPVDFKMSKGSIDKTLIEFKLASGSALKRNLEKQVAIYEKANGTRKSVKVIICYTAADQKKVARVLKDLNLQNEEAVVVIDARSDNKPSASKA